MYLTETFKFKPFNVNFWQLGLLFSVMLLGIFTLHAQNTISTNNEKNEIIIDEIQDGEIFAFGKTVIIRKEVKGVLVFGGDIIIEGKVDGDVATIGGSIIQKNDAFIGGDVIIFGGKYQHERSEPLRNPGKETIMYAGYEEELRNLTLNPSQLFSPHLTWSYFAQRLLSTLFWFVISLFFTTIAPGAISRAVSQFQLSTLKVLAIGMTLLIVSTLAIIASLSYLPTNISGIFGVMSLLLIFLAYFYGRVSLQVCFGKYLQKHYLPERFHSESIALFIGAVIWSILLSIPYLWTLAVVLLFAASLGLVITTRSEKIWKVG